MNIKLGAAVIGLLALSVSASYANPLERDLEYIEGVSGYVSHLQELCAEKRSLLSCGWLDLIATDLNHAMNTIAKRRASQGLSYQKDRDQTYVFPAESADGYSASQIEAILDKAQGNVTSANQLTEQLSTLAGAEPQ